MGVHLRGENVWPDEWGLLEEQTISYVSEIQRLEKDNGDVRTIYVSCGNRTSIQYFPQAVEPLGYSVLNMWTVFETSWPEGLAIVEALPFDEPGDSLETYVDRTTSDSDYNGSGLGVRGIKYTRLLSIDGIVWYESLRATWVKV